MMKVTVGYTSTAGLSIPITVTYTCAYCGTENFDRTQYVFIEGRSTGGVWSSSSKLQEEAEREVRWKHKQLLNDMKEKRYSGLHLQCTCKQCGRRQLWSSFAFLEGLKDFYSRFLENKISYLLIAATFLIPLTIAVRNESETANSVIVKVWLIGWGIFFLIRLLHPVGRSIKTVWLNSKIRKLDDAQLPHIIFHEN